MDRILNAINYVRGRLLGRKLARSIIKSCMIYGWTDENDIEEFVRGIMWQMENKRFWIPSKFGEENAK